jgi:hypothetical protein
MVYVLSAVSLRLLIGSAGAQTVSGTYRVTESWVVTLEYDHFAGYTGTKHFSGKQTGTLVITDGAYKLINQTGVTISSMNASLLSRTIYSYYGGAGISGDYPFAPAYGAGAYGLVFLGCFAVKVPLVDGEIPVFYRYHDYSAYGDSLSSLSGGGDMIGEKLRATVSSTITLSKVPGPPTILGQPQAQSVYAGQDATFSVVAGGDPPLSFAWRKGSTVLAGRTSASLTLTNVQSSDSAVYSVVVSNPGGKVTSSGAKLTVKPPPPAWVETWDSASLGIYAPATNGDTFISADRGKWHIGDTVANFSECWPDPNHADIVTEGVRKLLRLVSAPNGGGCAENVWAAIDGRLSQTFPIPLLRPTQVSFFEQGWMANPQWNGLFGCITPPCGDVVSLRLTDDHANQVVYILQRAPNYVEHAVTNSQTGGYLEVFLDPAGGTFSRNLFEDLARVSGENIGTGVVTVEFSLSAAGWAMLDDLRIGSATPPIVDKTLPTLTVTTPANNARLLVPTVAMTGTAKDNIAVDWVEFSVNGGNYENASGTTAWTATLNLSPGANTVKVRAHDISGNVSGEVTRVFTYVVSAPLAVAVSGNGLVSPNYNGQMLEVGKSYSMLAKPAKDNLFSGWTGSITSGSTKLTFVMQSNLVLQAVFIPNPFIPVAGSYSGLFYDTNRNGITVSNSGFITATVTRAGAFSGRLQLGAAAYPFSGQFSLAGDWTARPMKGSPGLGAALHLDLTGGDQITGSINNGLWTADVAANRAVYSKAHPAPQAGQYTLVLPGSADSEKLPGGHGAAAFSVTAAGLVSLSGVLGDGSVVTESTFISKQGQWPFYAPLYSKKGLILGWLTHTSDVSSPNAVAGVVAWIKPGQTGMKAYPDGFDWPYDSETNNTFGSAFALRVPLLSWTNGVVVLQNGNLALNITNRFSIGPNNKVAGTNNLKMTFITSGAKAGLFSGSVKNAATGKPISVNGAVLQSQDMGWGTFVGTNQSGSVLLLPN